MQWTVVLCWKRKVKGSGEKCLSREKHSCQNLFKHEKQNNNQKKLNLLKFCWIDLFSLYVLFSHYRPCDVTLWNCFLQKLRYPRAYSCITNEETEGKVRWELPLVWIAKIKPTRSIETDATRKKRPLQNAGNKKWDHTGCKLWLSLCLNKGCMYVYVV